MARKLRVHYSGAYYHVMLRGNGGMRIFDEEADCKMFLALVEESITRFEYRIHAYCLMTNHVHFVMQVGDVPLSKIIQNISFRYTRYVNRKEKRIGHLFQGRYKALLVDADNYLLQLIRYIHLNPLNAKMVVDLDKYLWSSHQAYMGIIEIPWLTTKSVIELLTQDKEKAVAVYHKFLFDRIPNEANDTSFSNIKSFPTTCDDRFMRKLMHLQKIKSNSSNLSFEELVESICEYYQVKTTDLHIRSQAHLFSKIRLMIAMFAVQLKIATLTKVATYFNRDVATFSRGLVRLKQSNYTDFDEVKNYIESARVQA